MTRARNRPKMFGSKNTELTVKYACTSLAAISLGFRKIVLVAYSTKPTIANSTASPARGSGRSGSAAASSRSAAAGRTPARTERRRTRSAAGPSRSSPSTPPAARTARRRRPAAARASRPACGGPGAGIRLARLAGPALAAAQGRDDERERAGRHHEVQRHEQVVCRPSGLDRDPERERNQHGARQHRRPPPDHQRRGGHRGERHDRGEDRHQRMAVDDAQLRRVPDVGQQEHRRQHQRAEHGERLDARVAVEHGHRGEKRDRHHPELGKRSAEAPRRAPSQ